MRNSVNVRLLIMARKMLYKHFLETLGEDHPSIKAIKEFTEKYMHVIPNGNEPLWYTKYKDYLKSKEWTEMKIDLIQNRGSKCENCGKKGNVDVHHLTYERLYKEDPEDLMLLCRSCHSKEHGK